jgi:hypothetical protein
LPVIIYQNSRPQGDHVWLGKTTNLVLGIRIYRKKDDPAFQQAEMNCRRCKKKRSSGKFFYFAVTFRTTSTDDRVGLGARKARKIYELGMVKCMTDGSIFFLKMVCDLIN